MTIDSVNMENIFRYTELSLARRMFNSSISQLFGNKDTVKKLPPLSAFKPFCDLSGDKQILMSSLAEVVEYPQSDIVSYKALEEKEDFYLMQGSVSLSKENEDCTSIEADSEAAKSPLSYTQEKKVSARVSSKSALFYKVPKQAIEQSIEHVKQAHSPKSPPPANIGSLPEVALKVKTACEDPEISLEDIADIISRDASISVKILQTSNSPIYRGLSEVATVKEAVCRLGKDITFQLVMY